MAGGPKGGTSRGGSPEPLPALLFRRFVEILDGAGTIWIFFLMVIICADVFLRGAFNRPITGTEEIVSFSIVAIVFLQAAHTLRVGRMTRNEFLVLLLARRFPRAVQALEAAFSLVGVAMFAVIFAGTLPQFAKSIDDESYYGNIGVFTFPVWPIKLVVLVGCAAVTVQYALLAAAHLRRLASHDRRADGADERELEAYR